jgi:hypothetical protein
MLQNQTQQFSHITLNSTLSAGLFDNVPEFVHQLTGVNPLLWRQSLEAGLGEGRVQTCEVCGRHKGSPRAGGGGKRLGLEFHGNHVPTANTQTKLGVYTHCTANRTAVNSAVVKVGRKLQ